MITKRKKNTRQRGSKTHGWGAKKKHRGAGNRGGRGKAGTGKRADQKKPTILKKYGRSYFGKFGFKKPNKKNIKAINLEYLEKNFDELLKNKLIKQEKDTFIINLKDLKINKLLGNGKITKKFKIIAERFSKNAKEKIEKLGGEISKE